MDPDREKQDGRPVSKVTDAAYIFFNGRASISGIFFFFNSRAVQTDPVFSALVAGQDVGYKKKYVHAQ